MNLIRYLSGLTVGRVILWCYLVWYLLVLARYFDPAPRLWLTSVGLSFIIGFALYISTVASPNPVALGFWPIFRLFLMPFCVSSFAALVKGRDFVLIFSPDLKENVLAMGICGMFCVVVFIVKKISRSSVNAQSKITARERSSE